MASTSATRSPPLETILCDKPPFATISSTLATLPKRQYYYLDDVAIDAVQRVVTLDEERYEQIVKGGLNGKNLATNTTKDQDSLESSRT